MLFEVLYLLIACVDLANPVVHLLIVRIIIGTSYSQIPFIRLLPFENNQTIELRSSKIEFHELNRLYHQRLHYINTFILSGYWEKKKLFYKKVHLDGIHLDHILSKVTRQHQSLRLRFIEKKT